jgi:uncharacterized protein
MEFEWDPAKADANRSKHGVDFELASSVMSDPYIFEDFAHSLSESRYTAIGFDSKGRMLTVSFTRPNRETVRIISARRSTQKEIEVYNNARSNT